MDGIPVAVAAGMDVETTEGRTVVKEGEKFVGTLVAGAGMVEVVPSTVTVMTSLTMVVV